jgi:hypothetical protein
MGRNMLHDKEVVYDLCNSVQVVSWRNLPYLCLEIYLAGREDERVALEKVFGK